MSSQVSTANAWWTTLRHGGVLISPLVLDETLPQGPPATSEWDVDKLRRAYLQFAQRPDGAAGQRHVEQHIGPWLDAALEAFLGHTAPNWQKGPLVGDRFKHTEAGGSIRKPNRVLTNAAKEHEPRFIVLIDKERLLKEDGSPGEIGVHGGRRTFGQLLGLMRATNVKLGVLTNGFQFRLVYAGLDHDAWVEWSAEAWFEGGEGRRALDGFRALLGVERIPPSSESSAHPLLAIVEESRKRQADLSHVMGTQVREAVELLLTALDDHLALATREERDAVLAPLRALGLQRQAELDALYQAAIRVVMRLVVTAYAESRELFPISQPAYLQSYSLDALFRGLQHAKIEEGLDALAHQEGAWARLVSHSRLVHAGSRHPSLQMVAYGGRLFEPPSARPTDPVMAGLAVFESPNVRVSDATVQRVLELLKIGKFRANRGKWLAGPVDFSDLRTEYIGMMYEGLLDYQLREAREEDGGIVFLNLGDQPALPLRVLTSLTDDRLKKLITELKKKTKGRAAEDEAEDEGEDEASAPTSDDGPPATEESAEEASEEEAGEVEPEDTDGGAVASERSPQERFEAEVMAWAERAVRLNASVFLSAKARKEKDATIRRKEEQKAARKLVLKSIRPGGTYLVRWSGTRKGSGTFYTKPALAVPTVNRTLEPLAYHVREDGTRTPRTPDEILALKVCDPAMGSGSFLVAALRYLTTALQESFEHHVNQRVAAGQPLASPLGENSKALYNEVLLPLYKSAAAGEGPDPAAQIEARLKRSVVERCIYGVDLNPLAVELGKLSLWVETMDPRLTFAFLDHKVKCGNSLIGAWQVQAEHYPLGAWERELGDGKQNPRTKRLQKLRKELIVPEMQQYLDQFDVQGGGRKRISSAIKAIPGQRTLAGEAMQPVQARFVDEAPAVVRKHKVTTITAPAWDASPEEVAAYTRGEYAKLHDTFDPVEQEERYRQLLANEGYQRQKFLLDMWCAAWFWPIRAGETAPLDAEPVLTPKAYYAEREKPGALAAGAREVVRQVAEQQRFLHWEIEYPEVFDAAAGRFGFDAVVGNPPWETVEAKTHEFFTRYDAAFRAYQGTEADRRMKEIIEAASIREDYWDYLSGFHGTKAFVQGASFLRGAITGESSARLGKVANEKWVAVMRSHAGRLANGQEIPFTAASGKLNLYALFTEQALATSGARGRMGLILPSGIYSDYGTRELRRQLYDTNSWEWVYSFENRRKIFDIDSRFKFAAVVVQRGGRTKSLRGRFYEHDLGAWEQAEPVHVSIDRELVTKFSPDNLSLLEVQHPRDIEILRRVYENGTLLKTLSIEYAQGDFNMKSDAAEFKHVKMFEERGYHPRQDGLWVDRAGSLAYPLYEGRMIGVLQTVKKSYVSGSGRGAVWRDEDPNQRYFRPQYLLGEPRARAAPTLGKPGVSFMDVTSASNVRTVVVTISPPFPHNHKAPRLLVGDGRAAAAIAAAMASTTFDFLAKCYLNGTSLTWTTLSNLCVPTVQDFTAETASRLAGSQGHIPEIPREELSPAGRAELREQLDAEVAAAFGLGDSDMRWILRPDNPDPRNLWRDYCERLKVLEAAGKRGRWYTLAEAREIRRRAGMKVDF